MPYDRSKFVTRTAEESLAFDFMTSETDFIAAELFAPKPVDKAVKKIYQFDLSKLRRVNTQAATNAEAPTIDEQLFTSDLTLLEYKLAREVNPRNVRDADQPALISEQRAIRQCVHHILLEREIIAATLALTSTNYPSTLTSALASGSKWNEAGGDPEADVLATVHPALINSCGTKANAVAMDYVTLMKLRTSPAFKTRVQYTNAGPVPDAVIKAFFDVDYLFISKARYDSSVEGKAKSINAVWGDDAVFFVHNPNAGLEDVGYGVMGLISAPFVVQTTEDMKRGGTAGNMKIVEVRTEYGFKAGMVVAEGDADFAAGYLLRDVVA
jgi:hypothetical protein